MLLTSINYYLLAEKRANDSFSKIFNTTLNPYATKATSKSQSESHCPDNVLHESQQVPLEQ